MSSIATIESISRRRTRELAARESDGVGVVLLWHPRTNEVTVSVEDLRTGDCFELAVEPEHALDAFYHPFAYADRPVELLAA